jgi:4-hydroxy-3-polyprenylbenzoate decarboxylase
MPVKKIVVAVTGASGSIYAKRMFQNLAAVQAQGLELEVGVVLSKNASDVWRHELGTEPDIPYKVFATTDFMAPFASGSARYTDMVVIPCSMGTLGRIAGGFSDDLITRAADVMLKERRRLICVLRDTPLNLIHIDNMRTITMAGGIILPAAPSFYSKPQNFDALADTVVHRVLDLIGLDVNTYRWGK